MKKAILMILIGMLHAGCAPDQTSTSSSTAPICQTPARQSEMADKELSQNLNLNSVAEYAQHNNFIVKFKDSYAQGLQPSGNAIAEYKVKGITMKTLTGSSFTFSLNASTEEKERTIQDLAADSDVEYIEPDYAIYPIEDAPTETEDDDSSSQTLSSQWALNKVKAAEAWSVTPGSKDIVVAVLDSGIDYTHNDLKNNMWVNPKESVNGKDDDGNGYVDDIYGWNFATNTANPISRSTSKHGTHVAGIIGGSGGQILGMAQKVKMMALKFIAEAGSGATSNAIRGIDYAIQKKVFAINNSWGSSGNSKALSDAIGRAEKAGILFVVAAGNGSGGVGYSIDTRGWYPASYTNSNILTVAATGSKDLLASFSNYGKRLVDVAAPGLSILSTVTNQGYEKLSGTSMAAPMVSGLAVLVKAINPALDYKQVISVIRNSVDRLSNMTNTISSGGRVNALTAVRDALNYSTTRRAEVGCN